MLALHRRALLEASLLQNFADMQLDEIKRNIAARRNRIFLLMEEVRRLRIQQRLKVGAMHLLAVPAGWVGVLSNDPSVCH
jgi:hypothetical protein